VTVPKHERMIERMTDAFWRKDTSVTNPDRMVDVLHYIIDELRGQPRAVDDEGCLSWAALYLEERLEAEAGE
jgi:hypothetical protein